MSHLTARELQVIDLMGRGLTLSQIAAELGISALTLRKHRSSIVQKLGLQSTAQLLAFIHGTANRAAPPARPLAWHILRPREAEIVRHVVSGMTSKEIARLLDISPLTVRKHRERARRKLGVHTLGEMIRRGQAMPSGAQSDVNTQPVA